MLRIRDHMAARGPDGKGEWYSGDGRVALGHRRLSIIDLSERSAQPMASSDGAVIISFNGEIYNYRALRRELENKGCVFRTDSDTEVILHLYADRGERMVEVLRGMYALALWDARMRALLLARDPYGIKPLYYADDGHTVRVASQVKALLAGGRVSAVPSSTGAVGFFLFGSIPEPHTWYDAVTALPAGALLWIDENGPGAVEQWFSVAAVYASGVGTREANSADADDQIRQALLESVGHHLVADVPVGAFLSAGIDSSAIVGLMRDAGQESIRTVTLGFQELKGTPEDEASLAEQAAARYGTRHSMRMVTEAEFQHDLTAILAAMDQPSIDGVNTWFVSKVTAETGLKVAVSGLGGDELFGGYPSFRDIPRWVGLCSVPSRIPYLGTTTRCLGGALLSLYHALSRGRGSPSPKALGLLEYGGTYAGAYLLRRGLFMPWELTELLDADIVEEGLSRLRPVDHILAAVSPLFRERQGSRSRSFEEGAHRWHAAIPDGAGNDHPFMAEETSYHAAPSREAEGRAAPLPAAGDSSYASLGAGGNSDHLSFRWGKARHHPTVAWEENEYRFPPSRGVGKDSRPLPPGERVGERGSRHSPHPTPFAKVAALEASLYMRNQLLRDADWAGMAHSLEIRVPLVDAWLLQQIVPFAGDLLPRAGKQLLAKSPSRPLPSVIAKRPKSGFVVPIGHWLDRAAELDTWRRVSALKHQGCHWSRRWAYTVAQAHGLGR